jgi:hypothetical protein
MVEMMPRLCNEFDKVAVCGSGGSAFESTSHMPRNMVSGKPSNQSARGVEIPPTTRIWFFRLLDLTCGNTCYRATRSTVM